MEVKDLLQRRRQELGLTMKDVAAYVGVSEGTVSRWESGDIAQMRRGRIVRLAECLKISPLIIMGYESEYAENVIPMPKMKTVPLLGTIACGEPILASENLEGNVAMPENVHADFALRCKGDSMINARIYNGDIVYIRQQDAVQDGEIAAVLIGDEATLKRVRIYSDHVVLEPENPQFRPMAYWGEDAAAIRILGKAVAFTSSVR